ncbi:MAG: MBL fold metallo-hydrolase, partial [Mariniphaga sp.]|nr:MBL fold metallo-hydrolase [Mariniphaga sp.]
KEKLLVLDPDTKVYCGHGPETTIGAEKSYNQFLS